MFCYMKSHYVYILQFYKDRSWYIGETADLRTRFKQHQGGEVVSTKQRGSFRLLFYECFFNKKDAKARERFLKSGFGRQQMKKALQHTLEKD